MTPRRLAALTALAVAVAVAAACGGGGDEGSATPPAASPPAAQGTGGTPSSSGAPIPGGGLSIEEALASPLEGPLMVKGYIVAPEGGDIRLCSALLESYPPQCGEPSLVVSGLDLSTLEGLTRTDDPELAQVIWSEGAVSLLGTIEDGVLTVSETSI